MKIAITQCVIDSDGAILDSLNHNYYKMFSNHQLTLIPNNIDHYQTTQVIDSDVIIFSCGNSIFENNNTYNLNRIRIEKHTLELAKLYKKPIIGFGTGSHFLTLMHGGSVKQQKHTMSQKKTIVYRDTIHKEVEAISSDKIDKKPLGATTLCKTFVNSNCCAWKLDNIFAINWNPEMSTGNWLPPELHSILDNHLT